ncbi:alkaline phosphatase family protein [bacterium]|nr:alkaline phosphatase family protein [candidate division CSSED10-310 bacterium]
MVSRFGRSSAIRLVGIVTGLTAVAMVVLLSLPASHGSDKQKLVILGFDGVDPDLTRAYMEQGLLPNISKLVEQGVLLDFGTTCPPESPVAWATFDTGRNPGGHGIYDFLRRDPRTYFPDIATTGKEDAEFFLDLYPRKKPQVTSRMKGIPFWKLLADNGVKVVNLWAPMGFPAIELPDGWMLSGLNTPDIRGTQATYHFFTTDTLEEKSDDLQLGGKVTEIRVKDGKVTTEIKGPWDPLVRQKRNEIRDEIKEIRATTKQGAAADEKKLAELKAEQDRLNTARYASLPFEFMVDKDGKSLELKLQGQSQKVREGEWSKWFTVVFDITPFYKIYGIVKFYVVEVGFDVKVYMGPIEMDPREPYLPISWPADFAKELAEKVGLFKVRGWAAETAGLKDQRIPDSAFLSDIYELADMREKIALYTFENKDWDVFISVFSCTDRMCHMFYRYIDEKHPLFDPELVKQNGDSVKRIYQKMDETVGKFIAKMTPDTTLWLLSDHGFHSFRTGININSWLAEKGYLVAKNSSEFKYTDEDFFVNVDWRQSKAYALGLGLIFINLKGREKMGIVNPGPEYDQLVEEISSKMKLLRNETADEAAVSNVFRAHEIYSGEAMDDAPDLVCGFADNYRVSWQTALGAVPRGVLKVNDQKWSGDHCSMDPDRTKGFFVSNKPLKDQDLALIDIAPTVLRMYGIEYPEKYLGKNFN